MKYVCDICLKSFSQKGHFTNHMNRANPCKKGMNIESIIEQKVKEVLADVSSSCKSKKDLGQYFTISDELQTFVFDNVKYKSCLLLEPSFLR